MQAFQIKDNKDFMKKLLLQDTFDTFLLSEATVVTYASFRIDGQLQMEYFSEEERKSLEAEQCGFVLWKRIRPFFFELMKGKRTPRQFQIIFRLAPHNVAQLLRQSGLSLPADSVDGLFLNIRFDGARTVCVTGTSLKLFTLDKSLEKTWDGMVEKFLRKKEIAFEA